MDPSLVMPTRDAQLPTQENICAYLNKAVTLCPILIV